LIGEQRRKAQRSKFRLVRNGESLRGAIGVEFAPRVVSGLESTVSTLLKEGCRRWSSEFMGPRRKKAELAFLHPRYRTREDSVAWKVKGDESLDGGPKRTRSEWFLASPRVASRNSSPAVHGGHVKLGVWGVIILRA
jgi:hypothetical protein